MECNIQSNIVNSICNSIENNTEYKKRKEEVKCEEIIKKQKLHMIQMQKKIKTIKYAIPSLQQKINNNKYKKALHGIFNEDQIAALCTKNQRGKNWSNQTVQRVLQLRLFCSSNGYEEVLRRGMLFLSLRIL